MEIVMMNGRETLKATRTKGKKGELERAGGFQQRNGQGT